MRGDKLSENKFERNPFEIRTRMLELAQEYLEDQYERNMEFARAAFMENIKIGASTMADWEKFAPVKYDFDEITKKAKELYNFVTCKG
jgi:hypothetical protein